MRHSILLPHLKTHNQRRRNMPVNLQQRLSAVVSLPPLLLQARVPLQPVLSVCNDQVSPLSSYPIFFFFPRLFLLISADKHHPDMASDTIRTSNSN